MLFEGDLFPLFRPRLLGVETLLDFEPLTVGDLMTSFLSSVLPSFNAASICSIAWHFWGF